MQVFNDTQAIQRNPELSREAPKARNAWTHAFDSFHGALQEGRDVPMKAERGADLYLSRHLAEIGHQGGLMLLTAMHEAMCGRANTAAEMLRDLAKLEAADYADNSQGAYE